MSLAALPEAPEQEFSVEELLYPDLLVEGELPERRVVYSGLSWARYLAIDRALGDERSSPRLYYLEGQLEIVTASNTHEHIKGVIELLVEEYLFRDRISHIRRGGATLRLEEVVGAEPDASWCIRGEKQFPDLVVEVALSSGGVRKLDIYQQLRIPEVWIWRKGVLSFYRLRDNHSGYDRVDSSMLVPQFDLVLFYRCVSIRDWADLRQAVQDGLRR